MTDIEVEVWDKVMNVNVRELDWSVRPVPLGLVMEK